MANYTREDILRIAEEEDVEFIRLQFTDIFGMMKNTAITFSRLENALNNECMIDVSSMEGFYRNGEDDLYLYPVLDTFCILPWRPSRAKWRVSSATCIGRTGRLIKKAPGIS